MCVRVYKHFQRFLNFPKNEIWVLLVVPFIFILIPTGVCYIRKSSLKIYIFQSMQKNMLQKFVLNQTRNMIFLLLSELSAGI